jgi:hypothetical protein
MDPHKVNLVADAAYLADADANVDADADADSSVATVPDAAVVAVALIALAASLPAAIPYISSIMNPHPPRGVRNLSDGSEILCSQSVQFQLNDSFKEDCDFDVAKDGSDMDNRKSNGTIIPVADLTPYEIITAAAWREAVVRSIAPSSIIDIDPVHKRWILQTMLDDWGIHSPHEFQL